MQRVREQLLPPELNNPDLGRYQRKVEELLRQQGRLEDGQVRDVLRLLAEIRRTLVEELLRIPPGQGGSWQAAQLQNLRGAIDRSVLEFARRYNLLLGGALAQAWDFGDDFARDALATGGVQLQFTQELSRAQLEVAQQFGADLVRRVGEDMRGRIAREVTLGVAGQRNPFKVMQAVQAILRTEPARQDPSLGPLATQAERIVRTEMGRVFNTANELRHEEIAEAVPGLLHYWRSARDGRTRKAHAAADSRYAPGSNPGPIPMTEPFVVGGEKLRFPHDPNGSAANTVQCRCVASLYNPDWFERSSQE